MICAVSVTELFFSVLNTRERSQEGERVQHRLTRVTEGFSSLSCRKSLEVRFMDA